MQSVTIGRPVISNITKAVNNAVSSYERPDKLIPTSVLMAKKPVVKDADFTTYPYITAGTYIESKNSNVGKVLNIAV